MTDPRSVPPEIEKRTALRIQYDEVKASDVVAHWMRGYAEGLSRTVLQEYDWFYDATKGVFVFRLYVRDAG